MKKYFRELSVAAALLILLIALAIFAPSFFQAATVALARRTRSADARGRVRHGARDHLPAD